MRKGPSETSHKDLINHRTPASAQSTFIQHGSRSDLRPSLLLALPAESLTHITSYLDPASLFVLGRTNKTLAAHIKDDNTWHSAFVCQFLGVGPEGDLHHADALTLRRSEPTWKREFVLRHHVRMRWLRSRVSPVTHTPHYTTISDIYMLPDDALLSSSIQYGIVARSQPLTGKIVKGYLNAAGTHHPAAAGNPNAEFTPDISACAIATDGPSARILWAHRDGSVAVMWHPRTMVGARAAARISTSRVEEEHQGPVSDAVFSVDGQACITAAADGRVKIWSLRRFGCAWTSPPGRVVEPLTHVREDLVRGAIVCATEKGAILVHSGFDLAALHTLGAQPQSSIKQYRIPVPSGVSEDALSVDQLFVDPFSRKTDEITLLVRRGIGPVFYRYDVNLLTGNYTETLFGSPAGEGYVQVLCPVFKNGDKGEAFVLAGTNFGSLCIYAWDARPRSTATMIPPTRRVDVFPDAHATAIAFHANVIAVGSASGTVRVFDTLTLAPLKAFAPHGPGHVQRILLRRDMLVVAVGTHVLAWKGLPIGSNARSHANAKGKAKKEQGERKWAKQIALRNDIAESAAEVDIELVGDGGMQRSWGQERAQAELGLSEREAVEYVLMLSRDEVLAQEEAEAQMFGSGQDVFDDTSVRSDEEGVFELDGLDNDFARAPSSSSGSSSSEPSPLLRATNSPTPGSTGSPSIRATNSISPPHHASPRILRGHSASNSKVQVSPRVAPEPTEAGGLSSSPLTLDPVTVPRPPAGHDFPTMASGATARSSVPLSTPGSSSKSAPGSAWSSPRRSAWATPLRTPSVSSSPSVPRSPPSSPPAVGLLSQQARNWDAADGPVGSRQEDGNVWERRVAEISAVEDEELRFALELSLAEERSRLGL